MVLQSSCINIYADASLEIFIFFPTFFLCIKLVFLFVIASLDKDYYFYYTRTISNYTLQAQCSRV